MSKWVEKLLNPNAKQLLTQEAVENDWHWEGSRKGKGEVRWARGRRNSERENKMNERMGKAAGNYGGQGLLLRQNYFKNKNPFSSHDSRIPDFYLLKNLL